MKKSILCAAGLAVIAALACVVCNDSGGNDNDKKGAADAFLDSFLDTTVTWYGLTVEINPAGGGTVSRGANETRYNAGDTVTVTAKANSGYKFTGWTGTSNDTAASLTVIMNSDFTLTANFIPITTTYYTLDVNVLPAGYGTVSRSPNKTVYISGESVNVTAEANQGYAFAGWSGASSNTTASVTITMNRDLALTANFKEGAYTLTLNENPIGGGSVSAIPEKKTYSYNDEVTVTAEAAAGYRFKGWLGESTDTTDTVTITMDGNKALTAEFIRTYTVTFDANDGDGSPPTAITIDSGFTVTLPDGDSLTRYGYTFAEWNTDSAGTKRNYSADSSYKPTADIMLYAKWTLNKYAVTFNPQGGSAVDSQIVAHGGELTSPASPTRASYTFGGWYREGGYTSPWDFETDTVTSDITLYANWTLNKYTVTFNSQGGGEVDSQVVEHGGKAATPDSPTRASYTLNGWYKEAAYANSWNFDTDTVTSAVTLYAKWNPIYTVTFSVNSGSGMVPAAQTVNTGESITLPNESYLTRSGYTFGGWNANSSGTGTNYNAGSSYTPAASVTLYAKWEWIGKGNIISSYKTVTIGSQVWMAENLDYNVVGSKCYDNSADSCAKYGRLYTWSTAMGSASSSNEVPSGVRGVCPEGWHLPSNMEWTSLEIYVNGVNCYNCAGTLLKSPDYWNSSNNVPKGTDEFGFAALPGGGGISSGSFNNAGYSGRWWSATEYNASYAWYRYMNYGSESVDRRNNDKSQLFSVRCVQD